MSCIQILPYCIDNDVGKKIMLSPSNLLGLAQCYIAVTVNILNFEMTKH